FFFQAEDGIRSFHVTGVQTCALPISRNAPDSARKKQHRTKTIRPVPSGGSRGEEHRGHKDNANELKPYGNTDHYKKREHRFVPRSEERRVGKHEKYQCAQ